MRYLYKTVLVVLSILILVGCTGSIYSTSDRNNRSLVDMDHHHHHSDDDLLEIHSLGQYLNLVAPDYQGPVVAVKPSSHGYDHWFIGRATDGVDYIELAMEIYALDSIEYLDIVDSSMGIGEFKYEATYVARSIRSGQTYDEMIAGIDQYAKDNKNRAKLYKELDKDMIDLLYFAMSGSVAEYLTSDHDHDHEHHHDQDHDHGHIH